MNSTILAAGTLAKWTAIASLTVLTLWFMSLARHPVKGGPMCIVRLELAASVRAADDFMKAWQSARGSWQSDLKEAQSWDTWFICTYAPLFALLCWIAADHLAPGLPRLGAVGYVLAAAQLLAGALDFVENAAMQKTIDAGRATMPWPLICATASGIKWFLILTFAVYVVGAGGHWAYTAHHSDIS